MCMFFLGYFKAYCELFHSHMGRKIYAQFSFPIFYYLKPPNGRKIFSLFFPSGIVRTLFFLHNFLCLCYSMMWTYVTSTTRKKIPIDLTWKYFLFIFIFLTQLLTALEQPYHHHRRRCCAWILIYALDFFMLSLVVTQTNFYIQFQTFFPLIFFLCQYFLARVNLSEKYRENKFSSEEFF